MEWGGLVGRGDQTKNILGEILAHEFCYSRTIFLGKVGVSSTSNEPEWASESERLSDTCGIGAFRCAFLFREPSRWRVGGAPHRHSRMNHLPRVPEGTQTHSEMAGPTLNPPCGSRRVIREGVARPERDRNPPSAAQGDHNTHGTPRSIYSGKSPMSTKSCQN